MNEQRQPLPPRTEELPLLTEEQLGVLKRFVHLDATLEDVRRSLEGVFQFAFGSEVRRSECHFKIPEPGVLVRSGDVHNALALRHSGTMTEVDLMYWATMILHNEAFEIDPKDEDFIAEALNNISFNLGPTTKERR